MAGYDVLQLAGDVSDYQFCEAMVEQTIGHFGRLDILVNNAGGGFRGDFENTDPEVFKKVIDANLMTSIYCTRAAMALIKEARGSIIFISSLSGIRGLPANGPYCIAKMGLTALAETLKLELHGLGVHIGLVMVGLTDFDEEKRVVGADGTLIPISRKSHQTREQVAKIVIRIIRKRKFRVVLTPLGKLNYFLQKISPSLVEWILIKSASTEAYNK